MDFRALPAQLKVGSALGFLKASPERFTGIHFHIFLEGFLVGFAFLFLNRFIYCFFDRGSGDRVLLKPRGRMSCIRGCRCGPTPGLSAGSPLRSYCHHLTEPLHLFAYPGWRDYSVVGSSGFCLDMGLVYTILICSAAPAAFENGRAR
jgi:hypothetical protein